MIQNNDFITRSPLIVKKHEESFMFYNNVLITITKSRNFENLSSHGTLSPYRNISYLHPL